MQMKAVEQVDSWLIFFFWGGGCENFRRFENDRLLRRRCCVSTPARRCVGRVVASTVCVWNCRRRDVATPDPLCVSCVKTVQIRWKSGRNPPTVNRPSGDDPVRIT